MRIDVEDYYLRYGPGVFRRCLSLLQDEDRAYDAMQEVFVRLIEKKDRLYDKYPSTLLFRMATNICLNMIRDERNNIKIDNDFLLGIATNDSFESRFIAQDLLDHIFHGCFVSKEFGTNKSVSLGVGGYSIIITYNII